MYSFNSRRRIKDQEASQASLCSSQIYLIYSIYLDLVDPMPSSCLCGHLHTKCTHSQQTHTVKIKNLKKEFDIIFKKICPHAAHSTEEMVNNQNKLRTIIQEDSLRLYDTSRAGVGKGAEKERKGDVPAV